MKKNMKTELKRKKLISAHTPSVSGLHHHGKHTRSVLLMIFCYALLLVFTYSGCVSKRPFAINASFQPLKGTSTFTIPEVKYTRSPYETSPDERVHLFWFDEDSLALFVADFPKGRISRENILKHFGVNEEYFSKVAPMHIPEFNLHLLCISAGSSRKITNHEKYKYMARCLKANGYYNVTKTSTKAQGILMPVLAPISEKVALANSGMKFGDRKEAIGQVHFTNGAEPLQRIYPILPSHGFDNLFFHVSFSGDKEFFLYESRGQDVGFFNAHGKMVLFLNGPKYSVSNRAEAAISPSGRLSAVFDGKEKSITIYKNPTIP